MGMTVLMLASAMPAYADYAVIDAANLSKNEAIRGEVEKTKNTTEALKEFFKEQFTPTKGWEKEVMADVVRSVLSGNKITVDSVFGSVISATGVNVSRNLVEDTLDIIINSTNPETIKKGKEKAEEKAVDKYVEQLQEIDKKINECKERQNKKLSEVKQLTKQISDPQLTERDVERIQAMIDAAKAELNQEYALEDTLRGEREKVEKLYNLNKKRIEEKAQEAMMNANAEGFKNVSNPESYKNWDGKF